MRNIIELEQISEELKKHDLLQPPFIADGKLISDFAKRVECYLELIDFIRNKYPDNEIIKQVKIRTKSIIYLSDKIIETLKLFLTGNVKEAYKKFDQA
ncbi:hypothetical protein AHZ62_12905, partial [Salmonella enterica subsp. enterica serovar Montevideo]|nr:hypothetical protein [Salmonella enterica]ECW6269019.1 hypothetical protein [Salmonella enterica subsp. enterica serovar Montevideo]